MRTLSHHQVASKSSQWTLRTPFWPRIIGIGILAVLLAHEHAGYWPLGRRHAQLQALRSFGLPILSRRCRTQPRPDSITRPWHGLGEMGLHPQAALADGSRNTRPYKHTWEIPGHVNLPAAGSGVDIRAMPYGLNHPKPDGPHGPTGRP